MDAPVDLVAFQPGGVVSTASPACFAWETVALTLSDFLAAAVWPGAGANRVIYVPFAISEAVTVYKIGWSNGATVNGNIDVGIYDLAGTRLVSSGSVAMSGATAVQVADITDTPLAPGIYHMAMQSSSSTATFFRAAQSATAVLAQLLVASGVQMEDTSFGLPATATFATMTSAYLPLLSLALKATF
jgi:hypothetical protein